ncbi:FtsX-like permease family protein [Aporhodopirellula aestuarii]|uniref:ABC transporter permease n=1 Tax=Aporhodopirellula aestuarii TaxID=2950107 RepID=A0ABT0UBN5_9BACT|nr:FtsX-like permease family protein [Aporhodopirellula aestuarii]MCM2374328.1 ABC transporter permease [Aporhodopirellula aestuarii]
MRNSSESFSLFSMIMATLRHRRAVNAAVAIGVATATAVITGALLVGDSMRGSLRELTIERLGRIESILAPGQFFPIESVKLPAGSSESTTASVILFPGGSVETKIMPGAEGAESSQTGLPRTRRLGGVQIVGIDDTFWDLDSTGVRPNAMPDENSVVLNQSAADELQVHVGDEVTLRLPVEGAVPADSPLGKRDIQSEGLPRMKVAAIVPDRGLGRFSLMASQAAPKTVFASRQLVAEVLDREGQANAILSDRTLTEDDVDLNLESLGWKLQRVDIGEANHYISLTSESLLLPEDAVDEIVSALPAGDVTSVMTYLANAIERVETSEGKPGEVESADDDEADIDESVSVPYSTIASLDSGATLRLDYALPAEAEDSSAIPIVLNDWAADRLRVNVGSQVRVFFYEPEVENGNEIERSFNAIVSAIVPIIRPAKPYRRKREAVYDKPVTPYNDPNLTPEVPGVTDQDSISDWDLPFQLDRKIDRADDDYWNEHRLTPKAFIPLAVGRDRFGSRFGQTTGLRINPKYDLAELESKILAALEPVRSELGWTPRSIRSEQLAASKGTTPFDGLFLALSMFVILAAMMLIAILLRLGVLQRIDEFGTLLAVGFSPRRVMAVVLGETAITSSIGVVIGVLGGIGYAAFVLWALRSWWVGAVTVPFLRFHASPMSIVLGGFSGWLASMATATWTLRFLLRLNPASLLGGRRMSLAGKQTHGQTDNRGQSSWRPVVVGSLLVAAIAAAGLGSRGGAQEAAGGFVGGGMLLLIAALLWIHSRLGARAAIQPSLRTLATANARRSPLRSTLTIGLVATAAFLILSITAFRMSPTEQGTGGFDLIAEAGSPIARDLNDKIVRGDLLGRDAELLDGSTIVACRMRSGDDASCNNLYQSSRPTVIGIPADVGVASDSDAIGLNRFGWASSAASDPAETWQLLDRPGKGTVDDPIPVVIDQNTAMWSLQMTGGIGQRKTFDYGAGQSLTFEVVGLLAGSILQGKLLIGEDNFESVFPDESGYRYFLIRGGEGNSPEAISDAMESRLVDVGMDVKSATRVLEELLAVQNTYLRTFQSLGALGLLLGTIGLAVSQLRSVLERRNELAVMQAVGFTRTRLAKLVLGENLYLLLMGMGCGVFTAIVAVLPYMWMTGNSVPIAEPLWILLGILVFGMLAGMIAVWRVTTLPLLESLRAEHAAIEL